MLLANAKHIVEIHCSKGILRLKIQDGIHCACQADPKLILAR